MTIHTSGEGSESNISPFRNIGTGLWSGQMEVVAPHHTVIPKLPLEILNLSVESFNLKQPVSGSLQWILFLWELPTYWQISKWLDTSLPVDSCSWAILTAPSPKPASPVFSLCQKLTALGSLAQCGCWFQSRCLISVFTSCSCVCCPWTLHFNSSASKELFRCTLVSEQGRLICHLPQYQTSLACLAISTGPVCKGGRRQYFSKESSLSQMTGVFVLPHGSPSHPTLPLE